MRPSVPLQPLAYCVDILHTLPLSLLLQISCVRDRFPLYVYMYLIACYLVGLRDGREGCSIRRRCRLVIAVK